MNSILDERWKQDRKWGPNRDLANTTWLTILIEEVGESAEEILEQDHDALICEVVQVAAVSVAWLERLYTARLND